VLGLKMGSNLKCEINYFNAEHTKHKVKQLLNGSGKWACPSKYQGDLICEFSLQGPALITRIDIGNYWSASVDISVGLSSWPNSKRETLTSFNFMNRFTSLSGENNEQLKVFKSTDFQEVGDKYWDRVRVTCKQPYRYDQDCFGLSLINFYGFLKNSDKISHNKEAEKSRVDDKEITTFIKEKFQMMKSASATKPTSNSMLAQAAILRPTDSNKVDQDRFIKVTSKHPVKEKREEVKVSNNSTKKIQVEVEDAVKVKEEVYLSFDSFSDKCTEFFEAILKPRTMEELQSISYKDIRHFWREFTGQDIHPDRKKTLKSAATKYVTELLESRDAKKNEENQNEEVKSSNKENSQDKANEQKGEKEKRRNRNDIIRMDLPAEDNVSEPEPEPGTSRRQSNVQVGKNSSSSRSDLRTPPSKHLDVQKKSTEKKRKRSQSQSSSTKKKKLRPEDLRPSPDKDGFIRTPSKNCYKLVEHNLPRDHSQKALGYSISNMMRIPKESLRRHGILYTERTYRSAKCLPLMLEKKLYVEAHDTVRFFKCGPLIHLIHNCKVYRPDVKDEFLVQLFKEFSKQEVLNKEHLSTTTKQFLNNYGEVIQLSDTEEDTEDQVEIREADVQQENGKDSMSQVECPLCGKSFECSLIQDHVEDCNGNTEDEASIVKSGTCPLCNKEVEISVLEVHAASCTGIADISSGPTVATSQYNSADKLERHRRYLEATRSGAHNSLESDQQNQGVDLKELKYGDCPVCKRRMKMTELQEHAMGCEGFKLNGGNGLHVNVMSRQRKCDFCTFLVPELLMEEHIENCFARCERRRVLTPLEKKKQQAELRKHQRKL